MQECRSRILPKNSESICSFFCSTTRRTSDASSTTMKASLKTLSAFNRPATATQSLMETQSASSSSEASRSSSVPSSASSLSAADSEVSYASVRTNPLRSKHCNNFSQRIRPHVGHSIYRTLKCDSVRIKRCMRKCTPK